VLDIFTAEDDGAAHLAADPVLAGDCQDDSLADREYRPREIAGPLVRRPVVHWTAPFKSKLRRVLHSRSDQSLRQWCSRPDPGIAGKPCSRRSCSCCSGRPRCQHRPAHRLRQDVRGASCRRRSLILSHLQQTDIQSTAPESPPRYLCGADALSWHAILFYLASTARFVHHVPVSPGVGSRRSVDHRAQKRRDARDRPRLLVHVRAAAR
jgi:hypothetical protein